MNTRAISFAALLAVASSASAYEQFTHARLTLMAVEIE